MDVEKRTVISAGLDPSGAVQGAQQMASGITQSFATIQRALLTSSAAFDRLKADLITGQKEAMAFADKMTLIWRSMGERDKLGQAAGMIDTLAQKFNLVGPAADRAKAAVAGMIDTTASAASRLQSYQQLLSTFQQRGTEAPTQGTAAYDAQRASIDAVYRVSKQYEDELNRVIAVSQRLGLTQSQTEALTGRVTDAYNRANQPIKAHQNTLRDLTGTTGQNEFAMRQLGVQTVQTFSGFATGQPIIMTLIQQMHQVIDVMLSSGTSVKNLATAINNFLNSLPLWVRMGVVIFAVAGALALMAINAEKANRQVADLATSLRRTGGDQGDRMSRALDVEAAARQAAGSSTLSFQDAFTAGSTLTQAGFRGTRDELERMMKLANDLAGVMGTDIPSATKILAEGIDDAAGAAQKLHDQLGSTFPGLTQANIDQLKLTQQAQGTAVAYKQLTDIIHSAVDGASTETTKLAKAWHDFQEQLTSSSGSMRTIGTGIDNLLSGLLRLLQAILETLQRIREWTPNIPESFKQGRLVIGSTAESGNNLVGLRPEGSSTGFQSFSSPEASIAQGIRQLQINQDTHKRMTLREQITRWAPPSENDTEAYIRQVAGETNINPSAPLDTHDKETVRKVITAIIRKETGHGVSADIISKGVDIAFAGAPSAALGGVSQADIDKAGKDSSSALAVQIKENQAAQAEMQRNIDAALTRARIAADAAKTSGRDVSTDEGFKKASAEATQYSQALDTLRGHATDLITEQQKIARTSEDTLGPLKEHAGAARTLAERENEMRIAARAANGGFIDQEALSRTLSAEQQKLNTIRRDAIEALDEQTNGMNAQNATIEQGGIASEHAANFEKAVIEAKKTAKEGTVQYQIAVVELTDAYDRNTNAVRDNAAAKSIHDSNQELEILRAEVSLIDASTQARERELAKIRERQARGLNVGDTASPEVQRAIDAKGSVAAAKVDADNLKASYNELANAASQSFDTIGNAMADAFLSGKDAAVTFQSVMKTVIQQIIQEMIKLAIINPILNSLFPGSGDRPTATSVVEALVGGAGKLLGGSSGVVNDTPAAMGRIFPGGLAPIGAYSDMIVNHPTLFRAYAQGGVMGEAGPEAIVPLVRGPSGHLGVRGGGDTNVVVSAPVTINSSGGGGGGKLDPAAIAALQKQIEGAVHLAARQAIVDEKRPGGDLFGR